MKSVPIPLRRRYALFPAVAVILGGALPMAHAQSENAAPRTSAASPSGPTNITPPQVAMLPDFTLPPSMAAPESGSVDLVLLVDTDGHGQVVACDGPETLCALVADNIAEGTFHPAERDGTPVAARIGMRFTVRPTQVPSRETDTGPERSESSPETVRTSPVASSSVSPTGGESTEQEADEDTSVYGASGVVHRAPAGALRLTLEETRDMPGAMGDPLRALEALPGVTPILSGLPYFLVRGSPPSGSLYVYDDINLPALFHLGLGPSVIHPRMLGTLQLHSGVAPARYGRYIGGVIAAEGMDPLQGDAVQGEVELRLLDVNGFVQTPIGEGELAIAGRYGYPGALLSIFSPNISLAYWDYQLRFRHPIGPSDHIEIVALGSYDSLESTGDEEGGAEPTTTQITSQFHRLEARVLRKRHRYALGSALQLGWQASSFNEDARLHALTFGSRLWARVEREKFSLQVGADMMGSAGRVRYSTEGMPLTGALGVQNPSRNDAFASAPGRLRGGAHLELSWRPADWLTVDMGGRFDLWVTAPTVEMALDPRLRVTFHPTERWNIHLAAGVTRQPAVFFLPLPGLTEVAIDQGLQTAAQGEAGFSVEATEDLHLEAQLFAHRYWNLLFPDLLLEGDFCIEENAGCRTVTPDPRVHGYAYGLELFARIDPAKRFSGFVSYTLARAQLDALPNVTYTPSFDIRHVLNVVARFQATPAFSIGLRGHLRSGPPQGAWYAEVGSGEGGEVALRRYEQRLPPFYRIDFQMAYRWAKRWGELQLSFEWLNMTLSREPNALQCALPLTAAPSSPCRVERLPPIFAPNLGLRGTFR